MGAGHSHEHGDHEHTRPVATAFVITALFLGVELVGGWWTGSLALIADAVHMAVDLIALGMTLAAAFLSRRPPDTKRTFGYKRVEVLAALGNGVALWLATGFILREAYERFRFPAPVAAGPMLLIAFVGLLCNGASAAILFKSSRKNLNARGAFLHVLSDGMGSIGAMIAGAIMLRTGWYQADPIASAVICVGIILASFWLLRDSIHILLEGAPRHLDPEEIRAALCEVPGVNEVHDLHLWSLTQGSESMSGHLVVDKSCDYQEVLAAGRAVLKERFALEHVTLQIEK